MRLPTPTVREVRWSFIVVFACAVALTATLCWSVIHKVEQSDQIVRIAASSASQVDRLSHQMDTQAAQMDAQAADSAEQRLLLQAQNKRMHDELTALLRYLRANGIQVPQTAITPRVKGSSATRPKVPQASSGASSPSHPKPRPGSPRPTPSPIGTPTPSPGPIASLCELLPLRPVCP